MIILTGASGGLGFKIFPQLAELDSTIGIYNKTKIEQITNTEVVQLDLSSEVHVKEFVNERANNLKQITIVNMATCSIDGLLAAYELGDWLKTFNVNINSTFILIKNLLPLMIRQKWGRIINISSYVGANGEVGAGAYSASKSALSGFTRSLAKEYGKFNITSNLLELGYFNSGLIDTLTEEKKAVILKKVPSNKFGDPSEISRTIEFLRNSNYINGSNIKIDGGL